MKRALFLFLLFFSFALALKSEWVGEIEEDEDVVLNNQESKTVILKRKPDEEGNIFKQQESSRGLIYRTSDGGTSTLTLQKDSNLNTDMSYFIQGDIRVSGNSHLIMNLNSTGGRDKQCKYLCCRCNVRKWHTG